MYSFLPPTIHIYNELLISTFYLDSYVTSLVTIT